MTNPTEFVDLKILAEKYGRPYVTLKRMAQQGTIPAFKFGRKWVIYPTDMETWIEAQRCR